MYLDFSIRWQPWLYLDFRIRQQLRWSHPPSPLPFPWLICYCEYIYHFLKEYSVYIWIWSSEWQQPLNHFTLQQCYGLFHHDAHCLNCLNMFMPKLMHCVVRNNVLTTHKSAFIPHSMINILVAFTHDFFRPQHSAQLAGSIVGDW